jgi:hypothetical protein
LIAGVAWPRASRREASLTGSVAAQARCNRSIGNDDWSGAGVADAAYRSARW